MVFSAGTLKSKVGYKNNFVTTVAAMLPPFLGCGNTLKTFTDMYYRLFVTTVATILYYRVYKLIRQT